VGNRKRAHGEGTYKKRKDGRWEAQCTVTLPDGSLKRKSVYAHMKGEVVLKLRKAIADSEGGLVFDAKGLTVAEYLRHWLEDSVKGSVWHTTYVAKPRQKRSERDALTLRQVSDFFEAAKGDRFEALYVLAVFTGMRPGEMLALRWADLILDDPEPVARVRRSLSKDVDGRPV
jgi:integrase